MVTLNDMAVLDVNSFLESWVVKTPIYYLRHKQFFDTYDVTLLVEFAIVIPEIYFIYCGIPMPKTRREEWIIFCKWRFCLNSV